MRSNSITDLFPFKSVICTCSMVSIIYSQNLPSLPNNMFQSYLTVTHASGRAFLDIFKLPIALSACSKIIAQSKLHIWNGHLAIVFCNTLQSYHEKRQISYKQFEFICIYNIFDIKEASATLRCCFCNLYICICWSRSPSFNTQISWALPSQVQRQNSAPGTNAHNLNGRDWQTDSTTVD